MSGITYINRLTGASNNLVYLETSDTTATATASGYLTTQLATINSITEGGFTWETNDCIMLSASDGLSWCSINSTFTTLTPFATQSGIIAASVTTGLTAHSGGGQTSATLMPSEINNVTTVAAAGNSVKFAMSATPGLEVTVINSGANPMQVFGLGTDTINGVAAATGVLQAAGATVVYRVAVAGNWISNNITKGTGTVSANAVTINAPVGVITTGSLTTASGADATAITLTNDFITTSSVILCQIQGGTNTTNGVTIKAVPGSGSASITLTNGNVVAAALNGTVIFSFSVQ